MSLLPPDRFPELFCGLAAVIPDADARRVLEALIDERGARAGRRRSPGFVRENGIPTPRGLFSVPGAAM